MSMERDEPGIDQRFPKLGQSDIDRLSRFGTMRRYVKGEWLYTTGQPHPGMFVIVSGSVALMGHEGLSRISPIVKLKPGDFTAELKWWPQRDSNPCLNPRGSPLPEHRLPLDLRLQRRQRPPHDAPPELLLLGS